MLVGKDEGGGVVGGDRARVNPQQMLGTRAPFLSLSPFCLVS